MLAYENGYAKCRPVAEKLGIIDPLDGEDAASEKLYQWLKTHVPEEEPVAAEKKS